jgi:hypothetical protein
MDEVEQRLRESADLCFKNYEAWRKNEKDNAVRAALQDAVHELRKIASRIEIELAVSERNEMAQKPIPIPPHRDARGRHQSGPADADDDVGNTQHAPSLERSRSGGQRRPAARQGGGGGHSAGGQGGPRRESSGGGGTGGSDSTGNE